ncbi:MAG: extracellular solute-binding protein [Rhodanobacter sp.]|nr:MAG: extracellular solute-binding protein [Rhodanobacter sp.]
MKQTHSTMGTFRKSAAALCMCAATTFAVSTPAQAKDGQINVMLFAGPIASFTQQNLPAFEKESGIKVNLTIIGGEVINTKTSTELLGSGTSFDVISIRGDSMPFYGTKGVLADLTPYLKNTKLTPADYDLKSVPDALMNFYRWDNKQVGMPWQVASYVTYYRKDLLEAAGLTHPPKTAAEYRDYAQKLNAPPKVYGTGLTMQKSHNLTSEYFQWLSTFGGGVIDSHGKVILDSPEARQALEYYVSLRKFAPEDVTNWAYERLTTALSQGEVAMAVQWTDTAAVMLEPKHSKVAGKMAFAAAPVAKMPAAVIGGWGLNIPESSHNKEDAFKFITWATGPVMSRKVADLGGTPFRTSLLRDKNLSVKFPWFNAQADAEEVAVPRPRTPAWPAIDDAMSTILSRVVTGRLSVDEGVTRMAAAAKKQIGN